MSGVTACQDLVDAAIESEADVLLVHHGYFWKGEDATLCGMKRRRIKALLGHDISLLAYHLPLDAHPECGNNAQLARRFGFNVSGQAGSDGLVFYTDLSEALSPDALEQRVAQSLDREPLRVGCGPEQLRRIAWCTGAAQSYIDVAIELGAEAFISGEISEPTVHTARENGIFYYAAGHHATERYGVQALGEYLQQNLGIEHRFSDVENPV